MQFENKFRKTFARPLTVSTMRPFPFLSPYFHGLFHCISCRSFFTSHHFSPTVSSNPSPGRWCPWKGGPLLNQWLLWSLAISSPCRQSIIPFLYFPSHLLTARLISSFLPPALLLALVNVASLPTFFLFPSPLLSSLSLWSTRFPNISTLTLRYLSHWPDLTLTLDF